ncbi:unnamed protein product [Dracunculus medinensis]|uniref:Propep_M14 domain-containing protein n=1 Tax=Dracunculus medinensis TaxID=318479 RepID=A0A0N4URX2_DRAME|nr:unnamed protein product [Dracunculus medinensis]
MSLMALMINFWKTARNIKDISDVMVPDISLIEVMQLLSDGNVNSTVIINDVEKLIIERQKNHLRGYWRRVKDDSSIPSNYDFHAYGSYSQMVNWMKTLAKRYSFVQLISIGKTHENRSIIGLEVP